MKAKVVVVPRKPRKREVPIEVIAQKKTRGEHKMETRVFARNIRETFCMEESCKYFGQHAAQGLCHTTKTFAGSSDWSYVVAAEKMAAEHVGHIKSLRKKLGTKKYIARLESEILCAFMNSVFHLDEMVRVRGENAMLRAKP